MSASALDDSLILSLEALEGLDECIYRGDDLVLEGDDRGDVHSGREGII